MRGAYRRGIRWAVRVARSVWPSARSYRRFDRRWCEACGYDLAGLRGGMECPECGAVREVDLLPAVFVGSALGVIWWRDPPQRGEPRAGEAPIVPEPQGSQPVG